MDFLINFTNLIVAILVRYVDLALRICNVFVTQMIRSRRIFQFPYLLVRNKVG